MTGFFFLKKLVRQVIKLEWPKDGFVMEIIITKIIDVTVTSVDVTRL